MKNNTGELKNFLFQALAHSPDDFALQEVKKMIIRAIDIVENVENKRSIRENSLQKRKAENLQKNQNFFGSLQAIEQEISNEKSKLEQMKSKRVATKQVQDGGNDLQNVFG